MPGTSSSIEHSPHDNASQSNTLTSFFTAIGQSQTASVHHYPLGIYSDAFARSELYFHLINILAVAEYFPHFDVLTEC